MPPSSLPCPNPVCTHVFTAAAVQGASNLTCPRCGGVFQFRQESAPPRKPTPPAPVKPASGKTPVSKTAPAKAAPPTKRLAPPLPPSLPAEVPLASPVTPPPVPLAAPVPLDPIPSLDFDETEPAVSRSVRSRTAPRRKRPLLLLGLLAGAALLGLAAIGTVSALFVLPRLKLMGDGDQAPAFDGKVFNFMYKMPAAPWKTDDKLRLAMGVHLAMRRSNPSAGMALNARDFKTRSPSENEMLEEATEKILKKEFKDIETEPGDKEATLGGQPCGCLDFAGTGPDGVRVEGHCYMLTYRAYAYWFITWAPYSDNKAEKEANNKEGDRVRQGFTLLNERDGWTEPPRPTITVQGRKIPYRLKAPKDRWKEITNRDGYDLKADLVLTAAYPGSKPDAGKAATFQALVLDKADSLDAAEKLAHDYVLEAEKVKQPDNTYLYPDTKDTEVDDEAIHKQDRVVGTGATESRMLRLRVEEEPNRVRYVVLRVLLHRDGVLVLWCECGYEHHTFWDLEFTALLDSVSIK